MRTIFAEALALLRDDHEDPSVRDACAALLSVALEAGVELPDDAALALFRWLVGAGSGRSYVLAQSLGKTRNEAISTEAVEMLRVEDASQEVRDALVEVLSDANACLMDDATILDLARRHEGGAQQVARMLEAAHDRRGISQDVLVAIRDRWLASNNLNARLGSIVVAQLTTFSALYWRRVIHDPSSRVRSEGARVLSKEGEPHQAIRIIAEAVPIEKVNLVKAAMLTALGTLVFRLAD